MGGGLKSLLIPEDRAPSALWCEVKQIAALGVGLPTVGADRGFEAVPVGGLQPHRHYSLSFPATPSKVIPRWFGSINHQLYCVPTKILIKWDLHDQWQSIITAKELSLPGILVLFLVSNI